MRGKPMRFDPHQFNARTLIQSLRSDTCPACGGRKGRGKSLCYGGCWKALPRDMKGALYRRIGEGYEHALADALNFLKADTFHTEQSK